MPFRRQGAICSGHSLLPHISQVAPLGDQGLAAVTGTVPMATANPGVPWIAGKPAGSGCFPGWLCSPVGGLTLAGPPWGYPRCPGYTCTHPMAAPAALLHLCLLNTLLWARAIREQPWMVAGLPAGLEPGTCFSPASIARAVARLGRGWSGAEPDFPAARASTKEGDLFCSWQASPLITHSLQMQDVHRERTWG